MGGLALAPGDRVATVSRVTIGAGLLLAAIGKALSLRDGLSVVLLGHEHDLSGAWVVALALLELALGVLLLSGRALKRTCQATLLLLLAFAGYHIQLVLAGGAHKACGCLGASLTVFTYVVPILVAVMLLGTSLTLQSLPLDLPGADADSRRAAE